MCLGFVWWENLVGDVTFGNNSAEKEEVEKKRRWHLLNHQIIYWPNIDNYKYPAQTVWQLHDQVIFCDLKQEDFSCCEENIELHP